MRKVIFSPLFVFFIACNNSSDTSTSTMDTLYSPEIVDTAVSHTNTATTETRASGGDVYMNNDNYDSTSDYSANDKVAKSAPPKYDPRIVLDSSFSYHPRPNRHTILIKKTASASKIAKPIPDIDTTATTSPRNTTVNPKDERTSILGYSCYKHIKQHETRRISAFVVVNNPASMVINELEEINEDQVPLRKSDTVSYFTKNITPYHYLRITLIDPEKNFLIDTMHAVSRQKIDSVNGNKWEWFITPNTSKEHVSLLMKVEGEKEEGNNTEIETKTIQIDISLILSFWREPLNWLEENPEKFLVLIIIPVVAFLGGRFLKRRNEGRS